MWLGGGEEGKALGVGWSSGAGSKQKRWGGGIKENGNSTTHTYTHTNIYIQTHPPKQKNIRMFHNILTATHTHTRSMHAHVHAHVSALDIQCMGGKCLIHWRESSGKP